MTLTRRALPLPLLLVTALLLAGCGGGDEEVEGLAVESSVGSGETVGTDVVDFELPEGWAVLDTDAARDRAGSEGNPLIDDLSGRMGVTEDQLAEQMKALELFAAAPGGAVDGFLTNVNVVEQPLPPGGLPGPEAMRPELMVFADEVGEIEPLDPGSGLDGLRATYLVESGGRTINGVQLYAEIDDTLVIITVSATEATTAAEVADLVESTLEVAS